MLEGNAELKAIAIDFLYDGMRINEDIFNHDGSLLLLAKGSRLKESQIMQLKNFNDFNRNISVFQETHNDMMGKAVDGNKLISQDYIEKKAGYGKIKDKTEELLQQIKEADSVSKENSDKIALEIIDRLENLDASLIFQCINLSKPLNEYLKRHCLNVGFLNGLMGKWLELSDEDVDNLTLAGLLHDVGKLRVPTEITDLPYRLTASEFEIMKMHTIYSYDLIDANPLFDQSVKFAARHHHEKLNGSGYPDKIGSNKISLFARITAVSDIYDAMVSKRAYKSANNPFKVIAQLANKKFSELDMKIVKVFTDNMPLQLVDKSVLMSDGSIGTVKHIIINDLEYPIVEINGIVKKTDENLYCSRMVLDI